MNLLESTTPGKHFSYGVHKPQRGDAYAYATEGEVGDGGRSFSYILHSARRHNVKLAGRNTLKNREAALAVLVSDLEVAGWIVPGQSVSV